MSEPFPPATVKKLLIAILENGVLGWSGHAKDEMKNDNLLEPDVLATIRGGVVSPGELRNGTYRYPIRTTRLGCAIAFRAVNHAVVVSAWRIK